MAISEYWLPIILEGISWVREGLGPSKKELKIQISDLDKQVQSLAHGNEVLTNNLGLIVQAILNQLKTYSNCTINADTIVFVSENTGNLNFEKSIIPNSFLCDDIIPKKQVEKI